MNNQQELIDEYLYYCLKQRKLDEKTVRAYRIDLRQFSEFCVQKKLVTEKAVIRQYILHLHESYKQKTVKRKVASIKAFYSYLEDEEIIDDSPLRKIRTEFREEKILPRSIPYSVLQSLLSSMYSKKSIESTIYERKLLNRDIAVVETLFSTGIRISELCNLLQKNIDIEQGIFCIKGKGGKERYLQIGTEEVLVQLKEYKRHWEKELDASKFFFLNRYGERYSEQSARRMIQRYTQEAMIEIHITPHMFRHAFATLLLEEEVDIRFIQKMLGHASIMTTQIYAEVALKKQMEILKMKHPRNRMEIFEKNVEMDEIKLADYVKFENDTISRDLTFTLADGNVLPDGLKLSYARISGTPKKAGTYTVVFDVTDNGADMISSMALEPNKALSNAQLTLTFRIAKIDEIEPIGKYKDKIDIKEKITDENVVLTITPTDGTIDKIATSKLYVAEYDENHILKHISPYECTEPVSVNVDDESKSLTAFVWSENKQPLAKTTSIDCSDASDTPTDNIIE